MDTMFGSFSLGIGSSYYISDNRLVKWKEVPRLLPSPSSPILSGVAKASDIPYAMKGVVWDYVYISEKGFGVATSREYDTKKHAECRSNLYTSTDGGNIWKKNELSLKPFILGKLLFGLFSLWRWGATCGFDSIIISDDNYILLSWDDPWTANFQFTHILFTNDFGESWMYRCLGYTSPNIVISWEKKLLSLNNGYYLESRDLGRSWKKRFYKIKRPPNFKYNNSILKKAVFTNKSEGFALCLQYNDNTDAFHVELLKTQDGGNIWEHVAAFRGSDEIERNPHHYLDIILK